VQPFWSKQIAPGMQSALLTQVATQGTQRPFGQRW
jgi:hypothetical protein